MKQLTFLFILYVAGHCAAQGQPEGPAKGPALRLWYDRPAAQWEETLPLGNGRLGMMPDGGVTRDNIVLNDITLWSGATQDANNYEAAKLLPEIRRLLFEGKNDSAQAIIDRSFICTGKGSGGVNYGCYQTLGNLRLQFHYDGRADSDSVVPSVAYERSLSLDSAVARCRYQVDGVTYTREYFTSFCDDADVIRLTADRPGQLDNGIDGKGMRYVAKVSAVLKGGSLQADGEGLVIRHVFGRVRLKIGDTTPDKVTTDKRLVNFHANPASDNGLPVLFYQFGRYLSISSTRVGLLPPNLQGLWANQISTPWTGDYHLDINVEMNHWPLEVSNLSELNLPLADLVRGMVPHGEKTARAYYHAGGWVAHVITNIWGFTEPGEAASWGVTKVGVISSCCRPFLTTGHRQVKSAA
jgi:alpha-L-fucosidase 2